MLVGGRRRPRARRPVMLLLPAPAVKAEGGDKPACFKSRRGAKTPAATTSPVVHLLARSPKRRDLPAHLPRGAAPPPLKNHAAT